MQNDILQDSLTPRECFMFAANLKNKGTKAEKEVLAESLIKELKLEDCADTFVGGRFIKGISGGQRKRTSIGIELVTNPDIVLLDEPTSGLDSFTSLMIIALLKDISRKGKNIIFTIH